MGSATRQSLQATRADLLAGTIPATLGTAVAMFAVADALRTVTQLRIALSDPSTGSAEKASLAKAVFGSKLEVASLEMVSRVLSMRWSSPMEMTDSVTKIAIMALAGEAEKQGTLGQFADELFDVARVFESNRELQLAIKPSMARGAAAELVSSIFGAKVSPATLALVRHEAESGYGARLAKRLDDAVVVVAEFGGLVPAQITTATELDKVRQTKINQAIEKSLGKKIHSNFIVDHRVVGGVRVDVGSEVIDDTIKTRLSAIRSGVKA